MTESTPPDENDLHRLTLKSMFHLSVSTKAQDLFIKNLSRIISITKDQIRIASAMTEAEYWTMNHYFCMHPVEPGDHFYENEEILEAFETPLVMDAGTKPKARTRKPSAKTKKKKAATP